MFDEMHIWQMYLLPGEIFRQHALYISLVYAVRLFTLYYSHILMFSSIILFI